MFWVVRLHYDKFQLWAFYQTTTWKLSGKWKLKEALPKILGYDNLIWEG